MDSLALWFAETLGQYVSGEAVIFLISMIPILAIYPFLQKYFVTGIVMGAVKE